MSWDDIEILRRIDGRQLQYGGGAITSVNGKDLMDEIAGTMVTGDRLHRGFVRELHNARDAGYLLFTVDKMVGGALPDWDSNPYFYLQQVRGFALTTAGQDRARGRVVQTAPPDPGEDDGRPPTSTKAAYARRTGALRGGRITAPQHQCRCHRRPTDRRSGGRTRAATAAAPPPKEVAARPPGPPPRRGRGLSGLQACLPPRVEVVGHGEGAAGAVLLTDAPVLVEGRRSALDGGLVDPLGAVEVAGAAVGAVGGDRAQGAWLPSSGCRSRSCRRAGPRRTSSPGRVAQLPAGGCG